MPKLINTIVQDAKPGMYVAKSSDNRFGIQREAYQPSEYYKAVKEILYCYDDGSIRRMGLGDYAAESTNWWNMGEEICELYEHVNYYSTVSCLNDYLAVGIVIDEVLDDIMDGGFSIAREHFSPKFNRLIEYLKAHCTGDLLSPPEPFGDTGFIYSRYEEDGQTFFFVRAVVPAKEHHEWKTKED